jgi:5-methylcytosine-specific restriction endonuclease McrA
MSYTWDQLVEIYDKNNGYCIYCTKKLALTNYGKIGRKGAWEVDHGTPRSRGGTNYRSNLWAVCIECNRKKSDKRW